MKFFDNFKKVKECSCSSISTDSKEENAQICILIRMGTCSIAAGARETLRAIEDEIKTRNLSNVVVLQTGCIGMCELEPIIEVSRQDEPKVIYGHVTPERARQIIASHVVNGKVVGNLVIS